MPPRLSTKCTITSAIASRVARYARSEWLRNQRVNAHSTGNATSTGIASCGLSTTSTTAMPTMISTDVTSVTTPNFSMSDSASMSDVWREMTRPDV